MLSNAAHYSEISNLPQFTNVHPKSKKNNSDNHWTIIIAYTFTKFGDNLTNFDIESLDQLIDQSD